MINSSRSVLKTCKRVLNLILPNYTFSLLISCKCMVAIRLHFCYPDMSLTRSAHIKNRKRCRREDRTPPLPQPIYIGGADKFLTRPTFRCRRTESIVSLERGVSSCVELQVFSCYVFLCFLQRLKGSMSGDARDFNNIETRAVITFFFSCKARRRRKFTPV